jgi:hypothetical protein
MNQARLSATRLLALTFLFALLLSSCSPAAPAATSTPTLPASTQTPAATLTPTQPPERIYVISSDAAILAVVQAAAEGTSVEQRDAIQPADLDPAVKLVFFATPPANLADLLTASPQTQFIVVSPTDLPQAANLSVIRQRPENKAFLAGFLGIMITNDYRIGGLVPAGANLPQAFINGGAYFCGLCSPYYAPVVHFPIAAEVPAGSPASDWVNALTELNKSVLFGVYVSPEASSPEIYSALADKRMLIIGGGQTPPDNLKELWAASLADDLQTPLKALFPQALSGKGGVVVPIGVLITDVNPDLLSPGRQALVQQALDDLSADRLAALAPQ